VTDTPRDATAAHVRCVRCKSERLSLIEVCEELSVFDDGVVLVEGRLYGLGDGYAEAGSIISQRLRCQACDHDWKPRRSVGGAYKHLDHAP